MIVASLLTRSRSSAAARVTVCAMFQLVDVNVSDASTNGNI